MLTKRLLVSTVVVLTLAGCASRIAGETNTPPPKGGPGGSQRHPPGVTEEDLLATCRDAFGLGWKLIKLYFMVGKLFVIF